MIYRIIFLGICFSCMSATASVTDSLRVVTLLDSVSALTTENNKIITLAKGFQGTPYAGGTLEAFPSEQLVVRLDSVDCTTFVESVLALAMTEYAKNDSNVYNRFKQNLQKIRYRGGILQGYASRLHYFSDWVADNSKKNLLKEVTAESPHLMRHLSLNFMSKHAHLYPKLSSNMPNIAAMKQIENQWNNVKLPYIPKDRLNQGKDVLKIQDGDILALVTNIEGLDVVHLGFAYWIDGKLHLIHASSQKQEVIVDSSTLYNYTQSKKTQLGIRVIHTFYSAF